ncbi:MAG: hypothetical protein U1D30_26535 [Planctomycetota bacterium]
MLRRIGVIIASGGALSSIVHPAPPSGVLLSVDCFLPLITVALVLGGLLLVFAGLVPPAAWVLAYPTEVCLWLVRPLAVVSADPLPLARLFAGTAGRWTLIFYLLFLPICLWRTAASARLSVRPISDGNALASCSTFRGNAPAGVEYHQLAVGHGNCGVLRYPTGEIVLYDCGSLAVAT